MRAGCVNGFRDGIALHHVHRIVFAAALGGFPLGGCSEKPDNRMLKPDPALTASVRPRQHLAETAPRPISAAPAGSRPIARAVPEKAERKATKLDPGALVGLAPPAIDRMLGRPAGTRTEAMTVEWTYIGKSCSLNIFFYPDIATGALLALGYNVTNTNERAGGSGACVNFLTMARNDEPD